MPWSIVADAHCSNSPEDGFRRRCDEHAEHMQHPGRHDGDRDDAKRSGWRVSQQ